MKARLLFLFTAISGLVFTACQYSYKEATVTVKNEFSMTVPDYLSETDALKPGAEFQYRNRYRNMYAVVFSDKKDKDFAAYYKEQTAVLKKVLEKPSVTDSVTVEIAGAKGVHTELAGKMQGEMIYYSMQTLEAKDKFYQVCVWTRGEDRKLKYGKDIQRILLSFRLLHH